MTDADYARKLDELDRLLNDPDVPMLPDRIWSLLADVAGHQQAGHGQVGHDQMGYDIDPLLGMKRMAAA
jgi:hypothetical protein